MTTSSAAGETEFIFTFSWLMFVFVNGEYLTSKLDLNKYIYTVISIYGNTILLILKLIKYQDIVQNIL